MAGEQDSPLIRGIWSPNQTIAAYPGSGQAIWRWLDIWGFRWHQSPTASNRTAEPAHETVPAEILHLVERPDLWHAIVDLAVRRAGRPGRAGQPLLPHQGRRDRSDAGISSGAGWSITAMPRRRGSRPGWHGWMHHTVDVPPDRGEATTPREWEKPHVPNMTGTAAGLPPVRLDAGERPPPARRPATTSAWTPGRTLLIFAHAQDSCACALHANA